jgi:hypothetical protein
MTLTFSFLLSLHHFCLPFILALFSTNLIPTNNYGILHYSKIFYYFIKLTFNSFFEFIFTTPLFQTSIIHINQATIYLIFLKNRGLISLHSNLIVMNFDS